MTPADRDKIDAAARRWFFDGVPTDPAQAAQLLVYMQMDGAVAEVHAQLLAEKVQRYDNWVAAGLGLLECYANELDSR